MEKDQGLKRKWETIIRASFTYNMNSTLLQRMMRNGVGSANLSDGPRRTDDSLNRFGAI
jgi:hypothetical protein